MRLPEAVRRIGDTGGRRQVYIEDYALQYLKLCRAGAEEAPAGSCEKKTLSVYGYYEEKMRKEYYIIYLVLPGESSEGAGVSAERHEMAEVIRKHTGKEWEADKLSEIITRYRRLGEIELDGQKNGRKAVCMFRVGNRELEVTEGYSVFYDENEMMKEYLSLHCEKQWKTLESTTSVRAAGSESRRKSGLAATRQASWKPGTGRGILSIYFQIRIAAICLLTVICVLAVTTVNNYDRLRDFLEKAVYTGQFMGGSAGDEDGKPQRLFSVQEEKQE